MRKRFGTRSAWPLLALFAALLLAGVTWGVRVHGLGYLGHAAPMLVDWAIAMLLAFWVIRRWPRRKADDADEE